MESWLCERPVLVNERCAVTKEHCIESKGGLWFNGYETFEECCNYYLSNSLKAKHMGLKGKKYVKKNFKWDVIMKKYDDFFENELSGRKIILTGKKRLIKI